MELINHIQCLSRLKDRDNPLEVMATFMFSLGYNNLQEELLIIHREPKEVNERNDRNQDGEESNKREMADTTPSASDSD